MKEDEWMKRSFGSQAGVAFKKPHVDDAGSQDTGEVPLSDEIVEIIETQPSIEELLDQKRTSLLEKYESILLDSTPTQEAYDLDISQNVCASYLSTFMNFDKDEVMFHTFQNENKIGVKILSLHAQSNRFESAAEKIIPVITNGKEIKFKVIPTDVDQESLEFEFENPPTPEELKSVFGRLAFIYHVMTDGIIKRKQVADIVMNLRRGQDIVRILIDYLVSLRDLNKLQALDETLPDIISQKLNGDYSSQALPGFERLPTLEVARLKFISSSSQTVYLRDFSRVFGEVTFQYGIAPDEINISTIFRYSGTDFSRSNLLNPNFNDGVMRVFSILNLDVINKFQNKFQFKRLENIATDQQDPSKKTMVLVLKYPEECSQDDLKNMFTRSVWLRKIGAKPPGRGCGRAGLIIKCINDLKLGENLVTNIEVELRLPHAEQFQQFPQIEIKGAINDQSLSTSFEEVQSGVVQTIAAQDHQSPYSLSQDETSFFLAPGSSEAVQRSGLFPVQNVEEDFPRLEDEENFLHFLPPIYGRGKDNGN